VSAELELRGLGVDFDGFRALDGVDLTVEQGELRFLIGPNGAGKTTIVDCITGLTTPSDGEVRFEGRVINRLREHQRVRIGIGRTFQAPSVFDTLSAVDNLDLAESFLETGALLHELAGDHTLVVIEHDMAFLRRFAHTVTVLHEGRILSEGTVEQVQSDPVVREVYLGRSRDERAAEATT